MLRAFHNMIALALVASLASSAFAAKPTTGVARLKELFTTNRTLHTKTDDPVKMLYRFLYDGHDAGEVKGMKFVSGAKKIETDTAKTGLLTTAAAASEVANAFVQAQMDAGVDLDGDQVKEIKSLVKDLAKSGMSFGFDGLAQNEGPTPYLIVMDPATRTVTGFDLNPSEP